MNVEEALSGFAAVPHGSVLVAKPPLTWGAEAMFVELTLDHRVPSSALDIGYQYLLGRDDIENLLSFLKTKKLSSRSVAEFIIHYAINDSAPAWIDDISNA